jgi:hypothetical protein
LQAQLIQNAEVLTDRPNWEVTAEAFQRARDWTERQISRLSSMEKDARKSLRRSYRRYWEKLNGQAGIRP